MKQYAEYIMPTDPKCKQGIFCKTNEMQTNNTLPKQKATRPYHHRLIHAGKAKNTNNSCANHVKLTEKLKIAGMDSRRILIEKKVIITPKLGCKKASSNTRIAKETRSGMGIKYRSGRVSTSLEIR